MRFCRTMTQKNLDTIYERESRGKVGRLLRMKRFLSVRGEKRNSTGTVQDHGFNPPSLLYIIINENCIYLLHFYFWIFCFAMFSLFNFWFAYNYLINTISFN